jgi:hypothetical protein
MLYASKYLKKIWLHVLLLATYSCGSLYTPNTMNVPMLSQKKEFNGTVAYGVNGIDVQAAYSPIKNCGVMANFAHIRADGALYSEYSYGYLGELGFGYYAKTNDMYRLDMYGGFGYTSTKSSFDFKKSGFVNRNYSRLFLQPSIGIQLKKFEPSLALRLNYVYQLKALFYEPAITLRFGTEKFKIMSQLGFSGANKKVGAEGPYNLLMFSVGFNFRFGKHDEVKSNGK